LSGLAFAFVGSIPSIAKSDILDEIEFQQQTPEYGLIRPRPKKTQNPKEWLLHGGGVAIHAPGYVDDRAHNLMPKKIDSRGIAVIAPAIGLSYMSGKWGASTMFLQGDSFGRKAFIFGATYAIKQSYHHHLKLHGAIYSRHNPVFHLSDRIVDYSMRFSYKTSNKKYEIFPIAFLNPGWRVVGPLWFEFATSYILSYVYFSIKF
jgi:hypothetical protein